MRPPRERDAVLVRGSRNEYIPANKAVIPTPEEEALDEVRSASNKSSNRVMFFFLLFAGSVFFRDEIEATVLWITDITTLFAKRIF